MEERKQTEVVTQDVAAVSVQSRLLPFWRELPRAWFIQFEAVVDPLKTSDEQKWRYVLQQLQAQDLQHLTDLLYKPPTIDKYAKLKERLLTVYDKSDVKNFQKLVSGLELGDQKPSQLLRKMKELSSGMITDEGLRIEWLNHLPTQIRVVLSVNSESSLDTLAAMADKMAEYTEPCNVAAVSVTTSTTPAHFDLLSKQIEKLSLEIAELRHHSRRRSHSRRPSRSRSQSRHKSKTSVKPGDPAWECRYHYRYGDRARQCVSPCARRNNNHNGSHPLN